jgi:hypothetical protein
MTGVLESKGWVPDSIGKKFAADGGILPFRGNTIICRIPAGSALFQAMAEIEQDMQSRSFGHRYAFLPPASYHMTVFNGANDKVRCYPCWPTDLPEGATMEECNEHFAQKLLSFDLDIELPIRVQVGAVNFQKGGSVRLAPVSEQENRKLRRLRNRLRNLLHCERPNQHNYEFHASISYLVEPPSSDEIVEIQMQRAHYMAKLMRAAPIIELGAPEFCTFENMSCYERKFYLISRRAASARIPSSC